MIPFEEWLGRVGLAHCAQTLIENGINLDIAHTLTEADLRGIGLNLGDTRRFLTALGRFSTHTAATVAQGGLAGLDILPEPVHAPAREQRHLTVMFCDLVDYTGLTQRLSREGLLKTIQAYYRVCERVVEQGYDGRVKQRLGDGVMVYFGSPDHAHEDDPERSVRAALEIVRAVKALSVAEPLSVRIGIATGPVIVGEASMDGSGDDGLAVGETPNLASRLQELAGPDEILIEPTTRRLVGNTFELADRGVHPLKGIVRRVQAWRVQGAKTVGRFEAAHTGATLTELVGRDEEMALLLRHWRSARGGEGQVVFLKGDAGIGKSRLTQELRERVKGEPHTHLRYQCSPFRVNSALYPIIEHIEFAAGFARDDDVAKKFVKLEAMLVGSQAHQIEAAALFADLLSLPSGRYPSLGLSPRRQKEKTFEVLLAQIEELSRLQPLLVVFEDAHWIDPTSQELLDVMIPQLRAQRVLMVITCRPPYAPGAAEYPHVTTMALAGLPQRLGTELVGKVTEGKPLPTEVVDQIVAHADGVPLHIEELTKSVLESEFLREEDNHYALLKPLPALDIPITLRASLNERLGRHAGVRELAQIGACIGREFSHDLLAEVSPYKGDAFEQELQRLIATGLVFRKGTAPDVTYTFKHALVQDAAYDLPLPTRREQLHADIAKALENAFRNRVENEPEVLAHHHTEAGHLTEAVPLWRKAGESALSRVALREAVAHLQKGLEIVERLPVSAERASLELSLREPLHSARLQWHGWAAPDVQANAEKILQLDHRHERALSLLIGLWGKWISTITQGRVAEAREWAARLLAEGHKRGEIDLQILAHRAGLSTHFYLGELSEAYAEGKQALDLYDASRAGRWVALVGNDVRTAVGVFSSQALWMLGYPDRAAQESNEKDADARRLGHPFDIGWALTWGAYVFDYRCEPDLLLERVEEADRLGREQNVPVIYNVVVPMVRGLALRRKGFAPEAIAELRRGISGWGDAGGNLNVPYLKAAWAEASALQGDRDAAIGLLDECLDQMARPSWQERVWLPEVLRLKGSMLIHQQRFAEAEASLSGSIYWARRQKARSWELRSATTLAGLWAECGRRDDARELLAPIYCWFTEGFDTHDLTAARALLDELR